MVAGSFQMFLNLPTEIRLQIWESVLPGPRVIKIGLSTMHQRITNCAPPVLLHVCRESRKVVLRYVYSMGDEQSLTNALIARTFKVSQQLTIRKVYI
jgi:hypothetical protein